MAVRIVTSGAARCVARTSALESDQESEIALGTTFGYIRVATAYVDFIEGLPMSPSDDPVLQEIVRRIVEGWHPERIILFGSRARGDADERSDVDLLVIAPVTDRREAAIAIRRRLRDLPVAKDIVVATPEEVAERGDLVGDILRPALRDGKALYERA